MTGHKDIGDGDGDAVGDGVEVRPVGRRSWVLKAAGLTLAGLLVLGVGTAGWAYWHLNQNIKSVDINSALGDDRPAKAVVTPSAPASASASPLPSGALNILVLGSDRAAARRTRSSAAGTAPAPVPTRRWSCTSTRGAPGRPW